MGWSLAGCWAERVAQRAERTDVGCRMRLEMGMSRRGGWRREEPLREDMDGLVWSGDEGVDEQGAEEPHS